MNRRWPWLIAAFIGALLQPAIPSGSAFAQETFHGYPCTVDCSGHEAGFDWAEQNGITDPGDCGGSSQSFSEGCEAFAEEYGSYDEESDEPDEDEEAEQE